MPNEDPTSGPLSDVFLEADPEMAAFMARHTALLERVTVLERALEYIVEVNTALDSKSVDWARTAEIMRQKAREALNG